jgi:hypothetical protein
MGRVAEVSLATVNLLMSDLPAPLIGNERGYGRASTRHDAHRRVRTRSRIACPGWRRDSSWVHTERPGLAVSER